MCWSVLYFRGSLNRSIGDYNLIELELPLNLLSITQEQYAENHKKIPQSQALRYYGEQVHYTRTGGGAG